MGFFYVPPAKPRHLTTNLVYFGSQVVSLIISPSKPSLGLIKNFDV